jgi:hypothetical protein
MKTSNLFSIALSILFFSANTALMAQKKVKDKVLASKVFTVELTETTGKKVIKTVTEEISFKSEKLNSKTMTSQNHFPAALYVVEDVDTTSTPHVVTFSSTGTNPDGEEVKWEGTVSGDEIEGSAIITKKGKTKKEYAYTGTLKVKGAPKK